MNELRDKVARAIALHSGQDAFWAYDSGMENAYWNGAADAAIATVMEATGWRDIAAAEIEQYEQNPDVLVFVPEVGQMIARYEKSNDGEYDWFPMDQCCTIRPTHWKPLDPPPPFEGEKP